jgi:hypothetical protein
MVHLFSQYAAKAAEFKIDALLPHAAPFNRSELIAMRIGHMKEKFRQLLAKIIAIAQGKNIS